MGVFRGTDGSVQYFAPAQEAQARANGFVPASAEEAGQAVGGLDDGHSGVVGAINAGATSALSGLTLGLSDAGLRALGSDAEVGGIAADRAAHPIVSTGANLAGALAPAVLSAGTLSPAALAGRAGVGVTERLGGGLAAKLAGGAVEGGIFGAGQGVSDLALSNDPLTWERAASTIGSDVLYGGAIGAGVTLGTTAIGRGLSAAKSAIDGRLAQHAVESAAADGVAATPELAELDGKGLKAARDTELEAIEKAQAPAREKFVGDLADAHAASQEEKVWLAVKDSPNRFVRGIAKENLEAEIRIQNLLKNRAGLAENPGRALDALQRQSQALEQIQHVADTDIAQLQRDFDGGRDAIRTKILAGKVEGELGPFSPHGLDLATEREFARTFKTNASGELELPQPLQNAVDHLDAARTRNADLQARIGQLTAEPTSPRLTAIDNARELLSTPQKASLGERLLKHVPGAGLVTEVAGLGGKSIGAIKQAVGKAVRRTAETTSAFLGAAPQALAAATPLATKVLAGVSYGPASSHSPRVAVHEEGSLPALFTARTDEIKSQTAYDASGVPRIRPEARQAIAARLQPVRVANPILGDRLETMAVRRLEYLSSLIPRRPDYGGLQTGPDTWHPSNMAMRAFARSVSAVEDPGGVEERVVHGSVTPEDAAAYWAVYPERARDFQQQIMTDLPTIQKTLPYQRRLSLGIFTGIAVDPSMHPAVLGVLQSQFPNEPGTSGGTQAPKTQPAFGSLKKSPDAPTPGQHRAQGATTT